MNKYNYVYRITNKENNRHYYGVRSSKIEPKLDLGIKYFSSSRDKEFMNEQKLNKDKFKYKVIKIFETREEAVNLEIKLHNKFDVGRNLSFYNDSKQTSTKFDRSGTKDSPETIEKKRNKTVTNETRENMRLAQLGRKHSEETLEKMRKPKSEEHKIKIGDANKGKVRTEEMKNNLREKLSGENHPMFGKTHSKETIEKMKLNSKNKTVEYREKLSKSKLGVKQKIVVCPHCSKEGGVSALTRWHFENCKYKQN